MPFHEDPQVRDIVQSHIEQVMKLEESEAERLRKRYRQIRQELRDRLDVLNQDTFTAQRVRSVLVQIEGALEAMKFGLDDGMREAAKKAALRGSDDLIREIEQFDSIFSGAVREINIDRVLIAENTENYLFNRYDASISAYSEALRSQVARQISDFAIEEIPMTEVVSRISRFFIGEEWKVMRLARTEIHHVYNMSRQNTLFAVADDEPTLKKTLFHPMDERTGKDSKQAAAKDLVVDVDKPFKYTFQRRRADGSIVEEERVFMVPPDRPNDRSIMVPYSKEWEN